MRLTTVRCVTCGRVEHHLGDLRALEELGGWLRDGERWACSRQCAGRAERAPANDRDQASWRLYRDQGRLAELAASTRRRT